ncbi:MAG: hypothetical protein ABJ382_00425 [Ilumatobacter sp.]
MLDDDITGVAARSNPPVRVATHPIAPLAAVGAIVTVLRLLVSGSRTTYSIWPDEPAQLAMARFLAGGTRWNMHDHSTWRPAYALLISPVYWFTDDATTVFRSAMVVNAALGGVAAVLLVLLTRRLTTLSAWASAVPAGVVMTAPASLFVTDFVWSESLVVVLFLATLLAFVRFDEAPDLARGAVAVAAATAAFATHSRMLPLVAVGIGIVLVAWRQGRTDVRVVAVCSAAAIAGAGFVQWASGAIVDRLWRDAAETNTVGAVAERAGDLGPLVVAAAGQWWYLVVSSLGIVGLGVWDIVRRIADGHDEQRRATAIVAVSTLGCVALSVVFMSERVRADRIVYGRYNDAVIAPVLVVGIAVLVGSIGTRRIAAVSGAVGASVVMAAVVLTAFRSEPLAGDNGVEPMILGLQPFVSGRSSIDVVPITLAALVLGTAVVAASRLPRAGGPRHVSAAGLIGLLLVVGGIRTADVIARGWNDTTDIEPIQALADGPLAGGEPVDFYVRPGSDDTKALMVYQFVLPQSAFTVTEALDDGDARYVVAPSDSDWPADHPARSVWSDSLRGISLWERARHGQ